MDLVENKLKPAWYASGEAPRLVDYATARLGALCTAAGFSSERETIIRTLRDLLSPWGETRLDRQTQWASDISDDNTPFELSVAISDGRPSEVRVLFEPQTEEPTLSAYRAAGIRFNERLERDFGADLTRFRLIEDLFLPEDMKSHFAVWSAVSFGRGSAPTFKAYFNPQARGREHAHAVLKEALRRLGMPEALSSLSETALRRGPDLDVPSFFALDLSSAPQARVKLYISHQGATPTELEIASSAAKTYVPGDALGFARAIAGGEDRLQARAPHTYSAFTSESEDPRPDSTSLYIPICAYARNDEETRKRVRNYLAQRGDIDPDLYDSIINGFANRPLEAGVGMLVWSSIRRQRGRARFHIYLAPEAYSIQAPGTISGQSPRRAEANK
jgi:hypothetical protein